jgi:hypothetical protein
MPANQVGNNTALEPAFALRIRGNGKAFETIEDHIEFQVLNDPARSAEGEAP